MKLVHVSHLGALTTCEKLRAKAMKYDSLFFYVIGRVWRQEKRASIFGHHSSIFPHSFKLVTALVLTHYEIFRALAPEGDVLLPKPYPDLSFDCIVR
jgi:hypothetical protein